MPNNEPNDNVATTIAEGAAVLGIELGSTRIKATLIGPDFLPLASGSHGWENSFVDGYWTYPLDQVWDGLRECYAALVADVKQRYGVAVRRVAAAGVSAMMHGYLVFDDRGRQLVPFRTWRNTTTGPAAEELGSRFNVPIPQRWSIAHLYQAILNDEEHVGSIARMTTLSGYVHQQLTGSFVLGANDASGMFPMKAGTTEFNAAMVDSFDKLIAKHRFDWKLRDLLPGIVAAGETAGTLSEEGARLLDPTGGLEAGIPFCPPEGDAGTGMVATNSIRPRTGNVSAGTSAFAMVVLETALKQFHPEIDMVMTPDSSPVAMAHSNNCTSDLDAWISLFRDAAAAMGCEVGTDEAFARLIPRALEGAADAGGVVTVPYVSGEHVTGFDRGAPLIARAPDGSFTVENVMRAHLFSALSAMKTGLNILTESESVEIDEIRGHGGFFKTPEVGRRVMAAVMNVPCSVMETAGEGGAWGMALLAAYTRRDRADEALSDFLDRVFADASVSTTEPDAADVEGYQRYFRRYSALLEAERAALSAVDA